MMEIQKFNVTYYLKLLWEYPWKTSGAAVCGTIKHLPVLIIPILIQRIIDLHIPQQNYFQIYLSIVYVVLMVIGNVIFHTLFRYLNLDVIKNISRDLRSALVNKLQILSISFHQYSQSGRIYSKMMRDVERLEHFGDILVQPILIQIVSVIVAFYTLALINLRVLSLYLIILPAYYILYRLFQKRFQQEQRKVRMSNETLSSVIANFIQTFTLSRIHGVEEFEKEKIDRMGHTLVRETTRLGVTAAFFGSSMWGTGILLRIMVIAIGAIQVIQGNLTVGQLVLFSEFLNMVVFGIFNIVDQLPVLIETAESIHSINEVMSYPDMERNIGKPAITRLNGTITFQQVTFGYDKNKPILNDISLKIKAGETIGLVGKSGAGKSTFISLILGLYRPQAGKIYLDEYWTESIDMRSVRRCLGVVTQDPILFTGNVIENIAHGVHHPALTDIQRSAQMANAHDFIQKLERGYETPIGERGVTLSGGQRQRIAIARAIFRKPGILILDEATSNLDSQSEREVQQALEKNFGKQTTLIIAHRLSTIFNADRIIVFKDGRIAESGTHAELKERAQGEYANLLKLQSLERASASGQESLIDTNG